MAGTNRNRTDWAILRVFYRRYCIFLLKKNNNYVLLVFGCKGGGGGWLPRNGSIIEQIWLNQQLLIEIGQIGPNDGY